MIQKLRVEKWGHFDSFEVNFSQGSNCVFGANQSGKTTLLNALCFALTGKTLSIKTKSSDYVKLGEKKSVVELDISINGENLRIIREGLRSAFLFELDGDMIGEELAAGATDVKQELMNKMNSKESFIDDWVFFREGEISHFLQTSTPTNRRKTVSGFVNVQMFEDIAKVAGAELTPRNAQEKYLKENLDRNLVEIDKNKNIMTLESERGKIEKTLANSDNYDAKRKLEEELVTYNSLKEDTKNTKIALEELTFKQNEDFTSTLNTLSSKKGELSGKLETLKKSLEILTEEFGKSECPTCGQHIDPQKKGNIIKNLENGIGRTRNLKRECDEDIEVINKKIRIQTDTNERFSSLKVKLDSLEFRKGRMEECEKELNSLKKNMVEEENIDFDQLKTKLNNIKNDISNLMQLEAQQKQNEKNMADLKTIKKQKHYLSLLQSGARYTIDEIGKRTLELVQDDTEALIEKLRLFKTGKLDIQTEYLMPTYKTEGSSINFASLSASEKLMCLISMRISLIKKLSNLEFIILDDPALQLDDAHTKLLAEHLRSCGVKQVIVSSSKVILRDEPWDKCVSLSN